MRNDIVQVVTEYKEGTELKRKISDELFAEKKSATRSEFYAAYSSGLSAGYVFEMDPEDFEACGVSIQEGDITKKYYPVHILFQGEEFEISRTYVTAAGDIEITVK